MRRIFPLYIFVCLFSHVFAQSDSLLSIPFGKQLVKDFVGSSVQIQIPKNTPFPINTLEQLLVGRVAGLQVLQTSGAPNSAYTLRLRGTGALYGSAEPLIVLDGVPINTQYGLFAGNNFFSSEKARYDTNPLSIISPYDIESITVHKDAIGTAMYGGRSVNGLLLITTKKGTESPLRFTYEASHSVQTMARRPQLLDATEYAQRFNELLTQNNEPPFYPTPDALGKGTEWLKAISRLGAMAQHHLQASGGIPHLRYMASFDYFNQNGVIQFTNAERLSGRASIISNWWKNRVTIGLNGWIGRMSTNMIGSYQTNGDPYGDLLLHPITQALRYSPVLPIYNPDGTFSRSSPINYNPVELVQSQAHKIRQLDIQYGGFLHFTIAKNLSWKTHYASWESQNDRIGNYTGPIITPSFIQMIADGTNKYVETLINYQLTSKKHKFELTSGLSGQTETLNYAIQSDLDRDLLTRNAAMLRNNIDTYQQLGGGGLAIVTTQVGWNAIVGLLRYKYADRFDLNLSQRRESNFSPLTPTQPSITSAIGAAWVLFEKLTSKETVALTARATHGWSLTKPTLALPSTNPIVPFNLPEQAHTNLGIELKKGNMTATIDIYRRKSQNLVYQYLVPTTTGSTTNTTSGATLSNQGLELSIQLDSKSTKDLKHSTQLTSSFQTNRLTKLEYLLLYRKNNSLIENRPAHSWQVFTIEKYDANGRVIYKDANKDGVPDLDWAGTANPSFLWGIYQQLSYKNVDMSLLIRGEHGQRILNNTLIAHSTSIRLNSTAQFYDNQWRPTNQNAIYPGKLTSGILQTSNIYLENGSFVRLQWVSLGYTLPPNKFTRSCRFYLSGQNLWLLTRYTGFDPEVNTYGQDVADRGVDYGSYPKAHTYSLGLQVQF